jgi:radical SAM family uncharacterized protein
VNSEPEWRYETLLENAVGRNFWRNFYMSLWPRIEPILMRAEKPSRYVGAEVGGPPRAGKGPADASIALAFPDLYEIGASYHGFRVLYERINRHPAFRAERAFAPWDDFEREMRQAGIPLYTLESFEPVRSFDAIGFTLQHEMNYTNILNMLDLAGLPIRAAERGAPWPLVIAGGEGAYAPELLAPFIDAFVLGDSEETILEVLACVAELKRRPDATKAQCLAALSQIKGVYVPSQIDFDYHPDGTIASIRRAGPTEGEPGLGPPSVPRFHRRVFDLASDLGPVEPVVPLSRIVHDRFVIEIRRGCVRGCRYCSSGMINRPVRERPVEQIVEAAERGLAATGYRDLSLLSLSSGDYSRILPLVTALLARFADRPVAIALPSLRISTFDVELADRIGEVRKTGFTFAPEAGTERLRRVINKPVSDRQFAEVVDAVCRAGWQTLKFYFMIGLPTEEDSDLDGIVRMVRRAEQIGRSHHRSRLTVNVTLSPFVPKPHTPFQWEPQIDREEMHRRYQYVARALERLRCVHVKRHSTRASFIEAVLARGDRRLADSLERAWRLGCRLDAWGDRFRFDLWMQAFEETGIDPAWYANRRRGDDEVFPWDHIDAGISRGFLCREREAAFKVVDGVDTVETVDTAVAVDRVDAVGGVDRAAAVGGGSKKAGRAKPQPPRAALEQPAPVQRVRISYSKVGRLKYLSHLDLVKAWQLLVERAALPMAYSRGFHPVALLQYSPALSVGYEGLAEMLDIYLRERIAPEDLMRRLEAAAPREMRLFAPLEIDLAAPALDRTVEAADYEIRLAEPLVAENGLSADAIERAWSSIKQNASGAAAATSGALPHGRASALKDPISTQRLDREEGPGEPARKAAGAIGSITVQTPTVFRMRVLKSEGNLTDPLRLLGQLLNRETRLVRDADVTRLGLVTAIARPRPASRAGPPASHRPKR